MCAILSPTFKVKEFKIEECQLFPITLSWKGAETDDNELEVFPHLEKIPLSKLLTIYKREPFEIEARYRYPNNIPFNDPRIGKFQINNVVPNAQGENSEVKLKARITKNGVFEISSPQLIETVEVAQSQAPAAVAQQSETSGNEADKQSSDSDKKGEDNLQHQNSVNDNEGSGQAGDEQTGNADEQAATQAPAEAANQQQVTKKKKTKATDLPLIAKVPQLNKNEINYFVEQEVNMWQHFLSPT